MAVAMMSRIRVLLVVCSLLVMCWQEGVAQTPDAATGQPSGRVIVLDMEMAILPGTQSYLEKGLEHAKESGASLVVVRLNTPGGLLSASQKMIQSIFQSPVPVVVYVDPAGASATSAGVFITLAAHIAAMAPGTSIGAAHPVSGDGSDIQGDMRKKAEEMTTAMVRSIAEQRGRNVEWAEKAVKESASLTETEALKVNVIDIVASDMNTLLKEMKGRTVTTVRGEMVLPDLSSAPLETYQMDLTDEMMNVLASPDIAALLWLAATTGITLELYNPGVVLPGVVGIICLILALLVSQVIPVSYGSVLLLVVGAGLLVTELYTGSIVLGVGGVIAVILGAFYLIDISQMPGLEVTTYLVVPIAATIAAFLFLAAFVGLRARAQQNLTGAEGMIGAIGSAEGNLAERGRVFVDGEYWAATSKSGIIQNGQEVRVVRVLDGMVLEVELNEQ